MSLNSFSPFTYDAQSQRDGVIASILYNKDITKKQHLKSADEIFPYLRDGIPDWLKDPLVEKAKNLITSANTILTFFGTEAYEKRISEIKKSIVEQIEMEVKAEKPDRLRIEELKKLIKAS